MLALVNYREEFHGIVGTETDTEINGVKIHVGDVVRVAETDFNSECTNVVAIFGDRISVMGLAAEPLSKLNVVEIVQSYKELEIGSTLYENVFRVKELQF